VTALVSTSSFGRAEAVLASRAKSEVALEELVVTAKLTGPFPETSGVTSSESVAPAAYDPDEAVATAAGGGAFAYVIVVSPQLELATPRTATPAVEPEFAVRTSVAFATAAVKPETSNR
jgi:hypothetical protein